MNFGIALAHLKYPGLKVICFIARFDQLWFQITPVSPDPSRDFFYVPVNCLSITVYFTSDTLHKEVLNNRYRAALYV